MQSTDSAEALGNDGTVQNWRATEVGKYISCQCGLSGWLVVNCRVEQLRRAGQTIQRMACVVCHDGLGEGALTANMNCTCVGTVARRVSVRLNACN
jgi:hypothetical protein